MALHLSLGMSTCKTAAVINLRGSAALQHSSIPVSVRNLLKYWLYFPWKKNKRHLWNMLPIYFCSLTYNTHYTPALLFLPVGFPPTFSSVCQFIMAALMAPVPSLNDMQNVMAKLIMTFMSLCEYCYYTARKHKKIEKRFLQRTVYLHYHFERSSILRAQ